MNNIRIAKETVAITADRRYSIGDTVIDLPDCDYTAAEVITPALGQTLLSGDLSPAGSDGNCAVTVTNEDSFAAASRFDRPLVMNFANAHHPGGGFMLGAKAQEEALCRCSTLYASLRSSAASGMYRYNNTHLSPVESDYMLISPDVCVFRAPDGSLLPHPFMTAVVTVPAPNRRGAALLASKKLIAETMTRRIRIMLRSAALRGYKDLVLGAWGCGAFGNDPSDVAGYFRTVLIDEHLSESFANVCFAVYGREDGANITAFRETFR